MEPLEQAAWQVSPAGVRRSALAEQYWERLLRSVPVQRVAGVTDTEPAWDAANATYTSPAALLAVQLIAARLRTDTSPVLLAAAAVALARVTGINPVVPRMFVSNRFRGRLAGSVSPVAQTCPCVIDVAGASFDEVVRRAASASIAALKHAYFKPVRIREVLAAVSAERGPIDLSVCYNDRRVATSREVPAVLPDPAQVQDALEHSTLSWSNFLTGEGEPFLTHIKDAADAVSWVVAHESRYISAADVERYLRTMEEILVTAALDPDRPAGDLTGWGR